jgi:hypothetical protein
MTVIIIGGQKMLAHFNSKIKTSLARPLFSMETKTTHVTVVAPHQPTYCHITYKTYRILSLNYIASRQDIIYCLTSVEKSRTEKEY